LNNNNYAQISGNSLLNVAIGMQLETFDAANPGDERGQTISSNYISSSVAASGSMFLFIGIHLYSKREHLAFMETNGTPLWFPAEWMPFGSPRWKRSNLVTTNNTVIGATASIGYTRRLQCLWHFNRRTVWIGGGSISNANYGCG